MHASGMTTSNVWLRHTPRAELHNPEPMHWSKRKGHVCIFGLSGTLQGSTDYTWVQFVRPMGHGFLTVLLPISTLHGYATGSCQKKAD
jgi:hypothetical protein